MTGMMDDHIGSTLTKVGMPIMALIFAARNLEIAHASWPKNPDCPKGHLRNRRLARHLNGL